MENNMEEELPEADYEKAVKLSTRSPEEEDGRPKDGLLTALLKIQLAKKNKDGKTHAQTLIEKAVERGGQDARILGFIFDRVEGKVTEQLQIQVTKPMITFGMDTFPDSEEIKAIESHKTQQTEQS